MYPAACIQNIVIHVFFYKNNRIFVRGSLFLTFLWIEHQNILSIFLLILLLIFLLICLLILLGAKIFIFYELILLASKILFIFTGTRPFSQKRRKERRRRRRGRRRNAEKKSEDDYILYKKFDEVPVMRLLDFHKRIASHLS